MDTRIRAVSDNVQHVVGWQELYGRGNRLIVSAQSTTASCASIATPRATIRIGLACLAGRSNPVSMTVGCVSLHYIKSCCSDTSLLTSLATSVQH